MRVLYSDEDIEVYAEKSAEITSGVFIHTNVKNFSLSIVKIQCARSEQMLG